MQHSTAQQHLDRKQSCFTHAKANPLLLLELGLLSAVFLSCNNGLAVTQLASPIRRTRVLHPTFHISVIDHRNSYFASRLLEQQCVGEVNRTIANGSGRFRCGSCQSNTCHSGPPGDQCLSFSLTATLFGLVFKFFPNTKIGWRDVFFGAIVTSLLFNAGNILIGIYLRNAGFATPFGAAGSLVVFVVWIYYSALIFFFGAELTQATAAQREHPKSL